MDATIIGAPSSTENAEKQCDPQMHQTRKGQLWNEDAHRRGQPHGAGPQRGGDASERSRQHPLPELLHGKERRLYGDSAYASQKALIKSKAPQAHDFTNQRVRRAGEVDEVQRAKSHLETRP